VTIAESMGDAVLRDDGHAEARCVRLSHVEQSTAISVMCDRIWRATQQGLCADDRFSAITVPMGFTAAAHSRRA